VEGQGTAPVRVLCVIGTRPEAIKLAPVIRELRRRTRVRPDPPVETSLEPPVETKVCVTAQHREMLDQVLSLFEIVPDHDLDVMVEGQTPADVAAAVLGKLEPVLRAERPDWVVVQGDTTTVAAASLGAYYARRRVAHVEAGLRTHDKWQPFPEEMNRRIAAVLADLHLCPTERARQNLLREGVPADRVVVTGNPVIDALRWTAALPCEDALCPAGGDGHAVAPRLILVTAHRRESFGAPFERICHALRDIAARYRDGVHLVYPVHPNPSVREPASRLLGDVPNITLLPPLDYLRLVHLMKRAYLVLTDSGGIQEEAPGLGKPVLVLREVTERPEAVEAGTAKVVGTDRARIVAETARLLEEPAEYERMARAVNPYGDGHAAERIVDALLHGPQAHRAR
jgi:UDP-N-acetylglucosamine 2-epimerase (non-hydrolysing)